MAQLNRARNPIKTHEGSTAKHITPEQQLRRSVMACLLWEREFYESGADIAERIKGLCKLVHPKIVSSIAIEARDILHLRHVPLLLARELARQPYTGVADILEQIIQRPDEITEFLAIYWLDGKQPISAQVKKGLARAFRKFDAYQLAKYNRDKAIKLRDVLFLCHAKPKDKQQADTWRKLVDGTLEPPDTWEVNLSSGSDKRDTWERMIREKQLGGLALLRNLRNMEEAGVPRELVREAIDNNPFGHVLPFRFIAAARHAPWAEPELERALIRTVGDIPSLLGKTVVLVDHSGSMGQPLSSKSDMQRWDAGAGLAMIARELFDDVSTFVFSAGGIRYLGQNLTSPVAIEVPPRRGFALRDSMYSACEFGGTYLGRAITEINARGYDRLIVLTDEQSHDSVPDPLPNTEAYMINVASAKNGLSYGSWTHIDGFSENVFRYIISLQK